MSIWKAIVKNEIRIKTYRFRKNRKLFLFIIWLITLYWSFYLGPNLFDAIIPEDLKPYLNQYREVVVLFIEYLLTMLFLIILMYPLYNLYRKAEIGHNEIFLATPVKLGDIFFGEVMGKLFFYLIYILWIGPIITSILLQLTELNFFQYIVIYLCLFGLMAFSLILGTIIANLIEHKMVRSKKAIDLNKSLLFLSSLIVIALFYVLRFSFNYLLNNPEFRNWLILYPSYWYSTIILFIVDPVLINSHFLNILINISLGIFIPTFTFYFSYKKAHIFYTLSNQVDKNLYIAKQEKYYYKIIRRITPNKWKGLVLTQFKEFFRKKENIIKMFYILALILIVGIIIFVSLMEVTSFIQFENNFHKLLVMMTISWMGGIFFGILMGINIFVYSKGLLFQYKNSPRGIKALVYSYLYAIFYIIIFLDSILMIIFTFLFQLNIIISLIFFFTFLINCGTIYLQAMGFQCFRPLFGEKGKDAYLFSYLVISLQALSLFIILSILNPNIPNTIDPYLGFLYILIFNLILTSGLGVFIFYFGLHKLIGLE